MRIFVSSTFRDLEQEREKIHLFLKKAELESQGMEFFVAEPQSPKEVCLAEIDNADLVMLIVSDNYGSIDKDTGKSFTHLEFDRAKELKKPILAFMQKDPLDSNVIAFQKIVDRKSVV